MSVAPPASDELLVVVGPTASGKSELAIELAERFGGEIVNADSVQIYRAFDVGSGKPSPQDRARVPHHLFDALAPLEPIDAGRYAAMADRAIDDIRARGRVPIVCGGTFLWVLALTHGLAAMPPADPSVRARHAEEAARLGRPALHERLAKVDPASAARLSPNDLVRVSRALEVWELSGRTMSELQAAHGFATPRYRARLLGVQWPNEALAARIAERTRRFLAAGWVDEVRELVARGHREARAMGSVGYRQVLAHVEGELAEGELPEAIDRATKVFARRQRTWLRGREVQWLRARE